MKNMKRRAAAAALAAALTLSLAGCAGGSGGSGGGAPKDPLVAAQEKMQSVKNMDATMTMEMNMDMSMGEQSQSVESTTTMDMTYFNDPVKLKAEVEVSAQGMTQNMSVYAEEKDGAYTMYLFDGANWMSQATTKEELEGYSAKDSMDLYLQSGSSFKEDGTEQVNGADATKYTGVIKGDALKEVMEASGAMDSLGSLAQLGVTEEQIAGMLDSLADMPVSVWLDKDYYAVKYEMDMTATMDSLMGKMIEAIGDQAQGLEMKVPKMLITMTCSNFDKVADFEIPAEALAA